MRLVEESIMKGGSYIRLWSSLFPVLYRRLYIITVSSIPRTFPIVRIQAAIAPYVIGVFGDNSYPVKFWTEVRNIYTSSMSLTSGSGISFSPGWISSLSRSSGDVRARA